MNSARISPARPIILVDDEPSWLHSLSFTLEYTGGYDNLVICSDGRDLIGMLRCQKVGLVLLDLVMPHVGGEDLLVQIVQEFPEIPVIVLSGLNQLETAVRCMKLGAFDYYVKTSESERLLAGIEKALALQALQRENRNLSERLLQRGLRHPEAFAAFVTRSLRMEAIFNYLEAVAGSRDPLLISGERGTGKLLAAQALHRLSAPGAPWVVVDAAALDGENFASLLCGGVGTRGLLDQARGGILFVRGIEALAASSQAALVRLLQAGEYAPAGSGVPRRLGLRLVCSTCTDLAERAEEGRFRRDLYYRLSVHQVHMPPLRERLEDLPLLIDELVSSACARHGWCKPRMPRNLAPLLASHSFPGNVSELRRLIDAAVENSPRGRLSMAPFQQYLARPESAPLTAADPAPPLLVFPGRLPTLAEAREMIIAEALRRSNGSQSIAARLLGISQPALSIHLNKRQPPTR